MDHDAFYPSNTGNPDEKIRVLLVDDHAVVRQGLRMFIEMQNDMEVVGEGANGFEAVELAATAQARCYPAGPDDARDGWGGSNP